MKSHYVATGYVLRETSNHINLLLVKQRRSGVWLPPGGHLRAGELPHKGAIREVKEETGLDCGIIDVYHSRFNEVQSALEEEGTFLPMPFCIMYEHIPASREGTQHMHIDFSYLMATEDSSAKTTINDLEITDAKWVAIDLLEDQKTLSNVISIAKSIRSLVLEEMISF